MILEGCVCGILGEESTDMDDGAGGGEPDGGGGGGGRVDDDRPRRETMDCRPGEKVDEEEGGGTAGMASWREEYGWFDKEEPDVPRIGEIGTSALYVPASASSEGSSR